MTQTAVEPGQRVLQRVVLPLDADNDVLPLYVEAAHNVQDAADDQAEATSGTYEPLSRGVTTQGGLVKTSETVTGRYGLSVPNGKSVSAGSYFNAFPAGYWQRWTSVTSVTLRLVLRGSGEVVVHRSTSKGHSMRVDATHVQSSSPTTVEFTLPLKNFIDGGWYWFDLSADGEALHLVRGEWLGQTDSDFGGTVTVGITTYNRPTFCVDQLEALAQQPDVLAILDEVLVIDQGTQKVRDDERFDVVEKALDGRLRVLEQANLGGSGGFSRAMDETASKGDSTYCLLLDDDVVCEPEGILRAVTFADLARTPTIVGGQMLSLYDRCVLHAAGETVAEYRWFWGPAMGTFHGMDFGRRSLRSTAWLHRRIDVDYNGWWMCLIPTTVIKELGLSLPMFIKWDDAEYGLRAKEAGYPTVTLPGVAVWHVPWHEKDDTLDWQAYFHRRNRIAAALVHSPYPHGGRLILESFETQVKHLLAMQYSAAEMGLMAIEDLLEGPQRMHRDVAKRIPELRALRTQYTDSTLVKDLEELPPAKRRKPPRKGQSPMAPAGKVGLLRQAALGSLRQLRPVRPESRRNPELAVPHVFLQWWRLAQVDSAVVSAADGASASWYQRDPELFRSLLRRSMLLHARLWSEWSELSQTYRTAVPELASPQAWRRTIADNAAD